MDDVNGPIVVVQESFPVPQMQQSEKQSQVILLPALMDTESSSAEATSTISGNSNPTEFVTEKAQEEDHPNVALLSNQNGTDIKPAGAPEAHPKPKPRRFMILTGMPPPGLPPRPVFPAELEHYQVHELSSELLLSYSSTSQYGAQIQAYLSNLRQDYERQLKDYEQLKSYVKEDTFFETVVVDELDAMDEDPFTLDSFENLMRMHANKQKDFILARVTTQDPNDETKLYHSYYGAHQINKVLFRTQPDEGLLHRMKARNPLNNMLVVGDVHYYIISAEDINAIPALPTVRSSCTSVSSHSSRMSRCSKLAAQAIASQLASARSSPILGSDVSLFSHTSDTESPVSIIPPLMALSILKADRAEGYSPSDSLGGGQNSSAAGQGHEEMQAESPKPLTLVALRPRRGSAASSSSTSSTASSHNGFQPGRPSRLRQTVDSASNSNQNSPVDSTPDVAAATADAEDEPECENLSGSNVSPLTTTAAATLVALQHPQQTQDRPLFRDLMGGRSRSRSRSRSPTVSSVGSSRSAMSTASSILSPLTNRTTSIGSPRPTSPLSTSSLTSSCPAPVKSVVECAEYNFRYLASDDDFLLRSAIRQIFKANALESWDAILFTISHNALREYSGDPGGEQLPSPPPPVDVPSTPPQDHFMQQPSILSPSATNVDLAVPISSLGTSRSLPSLPNLVTAGPASPDTTALPHSASCSTIPPSSSSSSTACGDDNGSSSHGGRLFKHVPGHASTSSLPSSSQFNPNATGSRRRRAGSSGLSSTTMPMDVGVSEQQQQQRRATGGKKIRQALSKIFSI